MIAGTSLVIGGFSSGYIIRRFGIKSSIIFQIFGIGIGSFLFCFTYHIHLYLLYTIVAMLYFAIANASTNFSICCIKLYGMDVGKKLQPIFLLNWLAFGLGNLTLDVLIYRNFGLNAFGIFSLVACMVSILVMVKILGTGARFTKP